jgi:hypothetical protein
MRYTVLWKPSASRRLAEIWVAAPDRAAVSAAANAIDSRLQLEPRTQGEGRSGVDRILIVSPLAVVFEVHDEDRLVYVLSVRYLPENLRLG